VNCRVFFFFSAIPDEEVPSVDSSPEVTPAELEDICGSDDPGVVAVGCGEVSCEEVESELDSLAAFVGEIVAVTEGDDSGVVPLPPFPSVITGIDKWARPESSEVWLAGPPAGTCPAEDAC
jgi:hypothetical protein